VGNTITNEAVITQSDQYDPNEDNNRDEAIITVEEAPTGGGGGAYDDPCDGKVIISEVAWSGTAANPNHEWIELRNIGGEPVDLTDWVIRWRKKEPVAPKDFEWKTVDLSGVLEGTLVSACELAEGETAPPVEFVRRDEDGVSWLVVARPVDIDDSYMTIERETDDTISTLGADIVYDTVEPYHMELSNAGDVIELIDENGTIVDTANAFDSPQAAGRPEKPAGSRPWSEQIRPAQTRPRTGIRILVS